MGLVGNVANQYQSCIDECLKCAQECEIFKDEHCQKSAGRWLECKRELSVFVTDKLIKYRYVVY